MDKKKLNFAHSKACIEAPLSAGNFNQWQRCLEAEPALQMLWVAAICAEGCDGRWEKVWFGVEGLRAEVARLLGGSARGYGWGAPAGYKFGCAWLWRTLTKQRDALDYYVRWAGRRQMGSLWDEAARYLDRLETSASQPRPDFAAGSPAVMQA